MAWPLFGISKSKQAATIAAGSITGTSAGTANTILTTNGDKRLLLVSNTLDQPCMLTLDGADWIPLLTETVGVDYAANHEKIDMNAGTGRVIGIYAIGAGPATGYVGVAVS